MIPNVMNEHQWCWSTSWQLALYKIITPSLCLLSLSLSLSLSIDAALTTAIYTRLLTIFLPYFHPEKKLHQMWVLKSLYCSSIHHHFTCVCFRCNAFAFFFFTMLSLMLKCVYPLALSVKVMHSCNSSCKNSFPNRTPLLRPIVLSYVTKVDAEWWIESWLTTTTMNVTICRMVMLRTQSKTQNTAQQRQRELKIPWENAVADIINVCWIVSISGKNHTEKRMFVCVVKRESLCVEIVSL